GTVEGHRESGGTPGPPSGLRRPFLRVQVTWRGESDAALPHEPSVAPKRSPDRAGDDPGRASRNGSWARGHERLRVAGHRVPRCPESRALGREIPRASGAVEAPGSHGYRRVP